MKKLLLIAVCCLMLCGCDNNNNENTITICTKYYKYVNEGSIEAYNATGDEITSYSLGFTYIFNTQDEANRKRDELLKSNNVYSDNENLIEINDTVVYEWALKEVKSNGSLKNKIKSLNNDGYTCETKDTE